MVQCVPYANTRSQIRDAPNLFYTVKLYIINFVYRGAAGARDAFINLFPLIPHIDVISLIDELLFRKASRLSSIGSELATLALY